MTRFAACSGAARLAWPLVLAFVVFGCGGSVTGSSSASPGGAGGTAGSTGAAGGSGGTAKSGSGGAALGGSNGGGDQTNGGTGNAAGAGGVHESSGGAAGAGGAEDAGIPGVCPGATPLPSGYPTCRTAADCREQFDVCAPDPAAGCGPATPPPECSVDSDCTGGQVCRLVSPDACGISNYCIPPCTIAPCTADEICRASGQCEATPCTSGFACGAGAVCRPATSGADAHGCAPASCSSDGYACPAGYRCAAGPAADPHGCADVSCTAGFTCPLNTDCNPSSTDLHHCKPRVCTTDTDCDCGACIENVCHARLNVCSLPPA